MNSDYKNKRLNEALADLHEHAGLAAPSLALVLETVKRALVNPNSESRSQLIREIAWWENATQGPIPDPELKK